MAKTNKYSSINFNNIFDNNKSNPNNTNTKPISPSPFPHKTHGGMLVLTRPTPKPLPILQQPPKPSSPNPDPQTLSEPVPVPVSDSDSDSISLRPLGRIRSASFPSHSPSPPASFKPEPFVPPHLRPGFAGKEEKIGKGVGSPSQFGEDVGPKSGGYERMQRGGELLDLGDMNRPGSSGNRPGSSGNRPGSSGGRYGSYRSSPRY